MNLLRLIIILITVLLIGITSSQAQTADSAFKDYTFTGQSTIETPKGEVVVQFGVNLKDIDRTGKTYTKFFGLRYVDDDNFLIDLISTDCGDKYSILGSAGKVQGKDTLNRPDSPEILVAKPKTQIARAIFLVCGERI